MAEISDDDTPLPDKEHVCKVTDDAEEAAAAENNTDEFGSVMLTPNPSGIEWFLKVPRWLINKDRGLQDGSLVLSKEEEGKYETDSDGYSTDSEWQMRARTKILHNHIRTYSALHEVEWPNVFDTIYEWMEERRWKRRQHDNDESE